MNKVLLASVVSFSFFISSCQSTPKIPDDANIWLEEIEGEKPLNWVRQRNQLTLEHVEKDERFKTVEKQMLEILTAQDRMPLGQYRRGFVYNFWQDKKMSVAFGAEPL